MARRLLVAVATFAAGAALADPVAIAQPVPGTTFIMEAEALDGQLLVVRSVKPQNQSLVSVNRATGAESVLIPEGVIDIARDGDRVLVVRETTQPGNPRRRSADVMSYAGGKFAPIESVDLTAKEWPGRVLTLGGRLALLSDETLRMLSLGRSSEIRLSERVTGSAIAVTGDGKAIYVGRNMGEWGGGLVRIDAITGVVTRVEKKEPSSRLCGRPLDTQCDPVTAAVADPLESGCIYAAIGLQHMLSHGRVLHVCGNEIDIVFEKTVGADRFSSEAVYGLALSGKDVIAMTPRGFYRLGAGQPKFTSMPPLETRGEFQIADGLPGFAVLATMANQRLSLSGPTPLLIPLD